jgi:hypothetical protein
VALGDAVFDGLAAMAVLGAWPLAAGCCVTVVGGVDRAGGWAATAEGRC